MTAVRYEYDAQVRDGATWAPLPVVNIAPSANLDRVPYADASITLATVPEDVWDLLDPRTVNPSEGGQVRWRLRQYDGEPGDLIGYLPRVADHGPEQWAVMYVRDAARTLDVVTLDVGGAETMIDDRIIIEDTSHFAEGWEISRELLAGRTVGDLVDAVLALTFGAGHAEAADETAAAALAVSTLPSFLETGYEVDAAPGSSFLQLIETQLTSTGCRLLDAWGAGWYVADRDRMPTFDGAPTALRWASHDDDLPDDVAPVILGFSETKSRGGDWADVVAVEGTTGELDSWRHIAAGGTHSRGRIIQMMSAQPSGNLAASIASRTFRRGHDVTIVARIALDVVPGMPVEIHLRSGVLAAEVVSVEWSTADGEMTVHARSAIPVEITTEERATRATAAAKLLDEAHTLARQAYTDAVAQIPKDDPMQATLDVVDFIRWYP